MKKDIIISPAKDISIGLVKDEENNWDVYLIHQGSQEIRNILIVTEGKNEKSITSKLRYFLESLSSQSFIKFETILAEVAQLETSIYLTYYIQDEIFEKEFHFNISDTLHSQEIPLIDRVGLHYT